MFFFMKRVVHGLFRHYHCSQPPPFNKSNKQACTLQSTAVAVYLVRWHLLFLHINQFGAYAYARCRRQYNVSTIIAQLWVRTNVRVHVLHPIESKIENPSQWRRSLTVQVKFLYRNVAEESKLFGFVFFVQFFSARSKNTYFVDEICLCFFLGARWICDERKWVRTKKELCILFIYLELINHKHILLYVVRCFLLSPP